MVVSLHAGLGLILEEGLDAVHARHAEAGRLLHEGLEEMGLELFAAEGHRLPELTTVRVPDGVDSAAVRKQLLERYDIEIGGGRGRLRGHGVADRPDGRERDPRQGPARAGRPEGGPRPLTAAPKLIIVIWRPPCSVSIGHLPMINAHQRRQPRLMSARRVRSRQRAGRRRAGRRT